MGMLEYTGGIVASLTPYHYTIASKDLHIISAGFCITAEGRRVFMGFVFCPRPCNGCSY